MQPFERAEMELDIWIAKEQDEQGKRPPGLPPATTPTVRERQIAIRGLRPDIHAKVRRWARKHKTTTGVAYNILLHRGLQETEDQ